MASERENTIGTLEKGTPVSMYREKKKEQDTMRISRQTMHIICTSQDEGRNSFDGAINIQSIKEIRSGKNSKDFDKWSNEISEIESGRCFVVFYGSEFNLKSLSVVAASVEDCEKWCEGLGYLVEYAKNAIPELKRSWWLRKSFLEMKTEGQDNITLQELKKFMQRVNCKIATSELKQRFPGEINYGDFFSFMQDLVLNRELFDQHFSQYSGDGERVTLQEFSRFRKEQQGIQEETEDVRIMRDFLQDSSTPEAELSFSVTQFMDYLFCNRNQIFTRTVLHNMKRPLSHYFIASSHNSYLKGNQLTSESSIEPYARCLRMGCRCLELDIWNGLDGNPVIFHGFIGWPTWFRKVPFLDVIKCIKEHAFETSKEPLILSLEDHCSVEQQIKMASDLNEVFGDSLVCQSTTAIDPTETELPSPENMRRRIILKHKKLPEGEEETVQMKGNLSLKINDEWRPHTFVLTNQTLVYREDTSEADEEESVAQVEVQVDPRLDLDSLHFSQEWFRPDPKFSRINATPLLQSSGKLLGDGTFLVRLSGRDDYQLSFRKGESVHNNIYHVPISHRQELGASKYYLNDPRNRFLNDQLDFDTLYDLVAYYQSHPLRFQDGTTMRLNEPAPHPNEHEGKPWYCAHDSLTDAEKKLNKVVEDGAFLVTPEEGVAGSFKISFRAKRKVKHCSIKKDGRLYTIGTSQFGSLVDLVAYYQKNPLYGEVRLGSGLIKESSWREIFAANIKGPEGDSTPVGMGSVQIENAEVKVNGCFIEVTSGGDGGGVVKLKAESKEEAVEWAEKIGKAGRDAAVTKVEGTPAIAQELEDLLYYCRTVKLDEEKVENREPGDIKEMFSFKASEAGKIFAKMPEAMMWYHKTQLSRTYPDNWNVLSGNYPPQPMWERGAQMIALNYQTGDKAMQINHAMFMDNGNCGYLLRPDYMFPEDGNMETAAGMKAPLSLEVRILGARHLLSPGGVFLSNYVSPYVEVEVCGPGNDDNAKFHTETISDNGLNPTFNAEVHHLNVVNPDLALLRFCVYDVNIFGEPQFLAQATYPVKCLRNGVRSIQLKNKYSEELELSTLLVMCNFK